MQYQMFNYSRFILSFILLILLFPNSACGVELALDTLQITSREFDFSNTPDKSIEKFDAKQLIVPGLFMVTGAIGAIDSDNNLNKSVRDAMVGLSKGKQCKIDDYIRFLPSATHMLLGFARVKTKHNFKERFLISATAHASMLILGYGTKYVVNEQRPDLSDRHSFPSGHVALAFTGAELMRMEYGTAYGIAGYAVAASVAFLRLYNNKHWFNDVIMGAGIGIFSARIGQWLLPFERKLLKVNTKHTRTSMISAIPFYNINDRAFMVSVNAVF